MVIIPNNLPRLAFRNDSISLERSSKYFALALFFSAIMANINGNVKEKITPIKGPKIKMPGIKNITLSMPKVKDLRAFISPRRLARDFFCRTSFDAFQ